MSERLLIENYPQMSAKTAKLTLGYFLGNRAKKFFLISQNLFFFSSFAQENNPQVNYNTPK